MIHGHDSVERGLEHRPEPGFARPHLGLGLAPGHELADLTPERPHRPDDPLVRLAQLAREELHHADDPVGALQRKAERSVQAGPAGRTARGKFPSVGASAIQIDSPELSTRPGRPSPGRSSIS